MHIADLYLCADNAATLQTVVDELVFLSQTLTGMASRDVDGTGTRLTLRAQQGNKLNFLTPSRQFVSQRR